MKTANYFKKYSLYALLAAGVFFTSCDDDDEAPEEENELEVITDVKLIFTNEADDTDIVEASAKDPDDLGVKKLAILDSINLDVDKTYTLTYEITNALDPNDPEDIRKEIQTEDDEHQFFFSFSKNAFADPTGNGNIDGDATGTEAINYNDDDGENPVGLSTSWTTSSTPLTAGKFTVRLQHQDGGIKTSTSGANDGDTDFELEFVLNIQ